MNSEKIIGQLSLLGFPVEDKVTGVKGVITSISFDITGCVQALVVPHAEGGELKGGYWFDTSRLAVQGDRVMEPISSVEGEVDGPCYKPIP